MGILISKTSVIFCFLVCLGVYLNTESSGVNSMRITAYVTLFIFLLAVAVGAKTVYVKSAKGIIKNKPNGQVIMKLKRGTAIQKIGQEGYYVKIRYRGKTGFISKYFVSNKRPIKKAFSFANLKNPNINARRRASSEVTAASARGAADENTMVSLRGGQLREGKVDMAPVRGMEGFALSDEEVEKFLALGKVMPR